MSYKLEHPYTEEERLNFIVEKNHQQGLTIETVDNIVDEQNYPTYYALERNEIMVDGVPTIAPDFEAKEQARLQLIEAQKSLPVKEKEKLDVMTSILLDEEVETNKAKLRTVVNEIAKLNAIINPSPTKFTVTKEQEAVLKPNTKYTITHNVNSIKAGDGINGVRGISITYTLEYTVDGSTVRTITSPSWISKIGTIIPDTFELTTGEDTGDHKLTLRLVGGHYGSLTPEIEFYVQEVTE